MSLKIALVGYGRMGKAVEVEAQARGHAISHRINRDNQSEIENLSPENCDLAIEFSQPGSALGNFKSILEQKVALVTGTTGWDEHKAQLEALVSEQQGAFLYSSNFSPGVNILYKLNQTLAAIMDRYPAYDPYVDEAHHRHKKDAPSGTALSLAEQVLQGLQRKSSIAGAELTNRPPSEEELSVSWTRAGEIIGRHSVSYISDIEEIKISHQAFNRRGFALGAVLAAEWLVDKKGFYNFADIF